jgi:PPOX class probable F420-dependent enzyme
MSIADEKYVSFTTYRKDGTPKSTPVWIVDLGGGSAGLITPASSWKVRRLANNPAVQLQPSDMKGNVTEGSAAISATAVVKQGADFDRVRSKVKAKYGWQVKVAMLAAKLGRGDASDTAIIVTLDD